MTKLIADEFAGVDLFIEYPNSIELLTLSTSLLWEILKARNSLCFNGDHYEPIDIVNKGFI
ncbi:hypothetical protein H5410_005954 [Solanum commersonii]|uniref:Uncharacterized protein n=1 Tax=Solanum commersonii TaxID=4109 RepID=A0A9J6A8J1_SOLCO|nr:hypothetical protein H5410_005954 [Solanum commersonii]